MADVISHHYDEPLDLEMFFSAALDRPLPEFVLPKNNVQINLGAGKKMIGDSHPFDASSGWWAGTALPFEDESVGAIYALNILEHLNDEDFILTLIECQRVLMVGAPMNISVPHWSAEIAYEDPSHKKHFSEGTWQNLFRTDYYTGGILKEGWQFRIGMNVVIGVVQRNLCILTQLIKTES